MAPNPSNSSSLDQLVLKGLKHSVLCALHSGRAAVNGPVYIGPLSRSVSMSATHPSSKLTDKSAFVTQLF